MLLIIAICSLCWKMKNRKRQKVNDKWVFMEMKIILTDFIEDRGGGRERGKERKGGDEGRRKEKRRLEYRRGG